MMHPPYVEKKMTILVQDTVQRVLKKHEKSKKQFIVGRRRARGIHRYSAFLCVMHSLQMIFCPAYRICM